MTIEQILQEFDEMEEYNCNRVLPDSQPLVVVEKSKARALLLSSLKTVAEEAVESTKLEEKEQLDKNDPDNYGACYAIGGYNDAIQKSQRRGREWLKNFKWKNQKQRQ